MSDQVFGDRPTVKIRLNAAGRGTIIIDNGPPLPIRSVRIQAGFNTPTVVSIDLLAINLEADLPVDEFKVK